MPISICPAIAGEKKNLSFTLPQFASQAALQTTKVYRTLKRDTIFFLYSSHNARLITTTEWPPCQPPVCAQSQHSSHTLLSTIISSSQLRIAYSNKHTTLPQSYPRPLSQILPHLLQPLQAPKPRRRPSRVSAANQLQRARRAGQRARAVDVSGCVHARRLRAEQRNHDRGGRRGAAGQRRGVCVAAVGGEGGEEVGE